MFQEEILKFIDMKKVIIALALLLCGLGASAQNYDWGIGIRGGVNQGSLNARFCLEKNAADLRISLPYKGQGMALDGSYEWCIPVIAEGMEFYYGPGLMLGIVPGAEKSYFSIGFQGVVGLDYKIPRIPVAAFIDYRPQLYCAFGNGLNFNAADIGLGLRITFDRK